MITLNEKELKLDCSNCGNENPNEFSWESDSSIMGAEDSRLTVHLIQEFRIRCLKCEEIISVIARSVIQEELSIKLKEAVPDINCGIRETADTPRIDYKEVQIPITGDM